MSAPRGTPGGPVSQGSAASPLSWQAPSGHGYYRTTVPRNAPKASGPLSLPHLSLPPPYRSIGQNASSRLGTRLSGLANWSNCRRRVQLTLLTQHSQRALDRGKDPLVANTLIGQVFPEPVKKIDSQGVILA